MKILSLGTPLFSCLWRDAGHIVRVVTDHALAPHPDNVRFDFFSDPRICRGHLRGIIDSFEPDIIFQGDHSAPLIHCGLEEVTVPKVWYSIDSHIHLSWHSHYAALFDLVFCAQKNLVAPLSRWQRHVVWLPPFCQRTAPFLPWNRRSGDVSFVGTVDSQSNSRRTRFFDDLKRLGVSVHCVRGDFVPVYQSSRMVVNQSVADDLNLRFFEATGCGALLITDRLTHSLNDLLEENEDYLTYSADDAADCAGKIAWVRSHPGEAEAMARRAHAKVHASHLVAHRARSVLDCLLLCLESHSRDRAVSPGAVVHLASAHEYCSRLRLPERLSAFFEKEASRLASSCLDNSEARPWALLLLASQALAGGNDPRAESLLDQSGDIPADPVFREQRHILTIQLAMLRGHLQSVRELLSAARIEFPGSTQLQELDSLMNRA